jgi:hypothetical protein
MVVLFLIFEDLQLIFDKSARLYNEEKIYSSANDAETIVCHHAKE